MLVTVLSVAMVMLRGHLIFGLPMDGKMRNPRALSDKLCNPGQYKSADSCVACKPGFYTSEENREETCHRCFQNCRPEFNMEVKKNCTRTSDLECDCREGYKCVKDPHTRHCDSCVPDPITISSSTSTDVPSTTASTTTSTEIAQIKLADSSAEVWVVCGLIFVMLSIIVLILFLRLCRKKEKECFKHFVRQCSLGNIEVNSETAPPTSQPDEQPQDMLSHGSTPTNHNTDCSFHQPISSEQAMPPTGNLGPLHIYGPQTVFVSLLNQFGWDGGEKKTQEIQEESLNNINVPYSQSPPVHLSEEEMSGDNDFIFFPSQEQGKECHISKEEVL